MNEDRISEPEEKSWLEKIAHAFSSEPKSRDDLLDVLKVAQQNEVIDSDALKIIDGAMQVTEMQVREIMVPRTQMTVIKAEDPLSELLPQIIQTAHSRYPVIGENTDEVLGILLAKDLLPPYSSITIAIWFLFSRNSRSNTFRRLLSGTTVAGRSILVTIEDVLEEIVGEIEDEHDVEPDSYIKKLAENDYIVKALTPIDDFNQTFEAEFSDEEFDTIGVIILKQFGHLPRRNEVATVDGYEFKVINADSRQVHLLRMSEITAI